MISPRWFLARMAVVTVVASFVIAPIGASATPADNPPTAESLEIAAEHYNLTRLKVDRATAALDATDRRIAAAQARVLLVRTRTRTRAAALYQGTTVDSPLAIARGRELADAHRRSTYLDAAERPDRTLLDSLGSELANLANERASQRDVREMLQHNVTEAAKAKRTLQTLAAAAAARGVQSTHDGAGALATAPGSTSPGAGANPSANPGSGSSGTTTTTVVHAPPTSPPPGPGPSNPPPSGNGPAVNPGAGTAVAFARAQLGKPYVFATAGPNTYDCSGLTMAAWAAAGVRMPHYSGSQATMFPKVTWQQLQPGDLVLFYSDLHHVGLYIGGGMMIHAPQTGDVVKIAPAWRDTFMWGVRPG
ncbi:MAG: C40 family peptidase [Acidimicrobiia bacterium]